MSKPLGWRSIDFCSFKKYHQCECPSYFVIPMRSCLIVEMTKPQCLYCLPRLGAIMWHTFLLHLLLLRNLWHFWSTHHCHKGPWAKVARRYRTLLPLAIVGIALTGEEKITVIYSPKTFPFRQAETVHPWYTFPHRLLCISKEEKNFLILSSLFGSSQSPLVFLI